MEGIHLHLPARNSIVSLAPACATSHPGPLPPPRALDAGAAWWLLRPTSPGTSNGLKQSVALSRHHEPPEATEDPFGCMYSIYSMRIR